MDYLDKYLKYKKKYINLKNKKKLSDNKFSHKFYITHKTWSSSIPHILNDGFIRAGKDIPKKFKILSSFTLIFLIESFLLNLSI